MASCRAALFVAPMYTHSVIGLPVAEGHAMIAEILRAGMAAPHGAPVYNHEWKQLDLVAWDVSAAAALSDECCSSAYALVALAGIIRSNSDCRAACPQPEIYSVGPESTSWPSTISLV